MVSETGRWRGEGAGGRSGERAPGRHSWEVLTDILAYDDEPAADLPTAAIFEWGADRIAALCSPEASPLGLGLCSPEASPLGLGL